MLRYLGLGKRFYGDRPMPPHKRVNWEFLAVVRGRIAPFERDEARPPPVADTFWLYPPGVVHGWVGEPGRSCELIVIHFSTVPPALERVTLLHGHLQTGLSAADKALLRRIANQLKRHYWRPTLEGDIRADRALMDLSLLILRDYEERRQPREVGGSLQKVITAEDWLRAHLLENPSIAEAAQVIGLSASQLNRLFVRVRKESPQQVLNRLKIGRAMELLGSTNAKLQSIADECGFSSASNLCRAFKAAKGHPPTKWRHEIYIRYKRATGATRGDPTEHGHRSRPVS
ncbi:MAG TPA: AraC family transcriptional regulator [Candidatus Synoicihabitans sp.]|nr:AraC family transcriptional regulator [Candidatus Synoicihabitans sp.]